jgi:pyrrolidone-carboxylate peptidase
VQRKKRERTPLFSGIYDFFSNIFQVFSTGFSPDTLQEYLDTIIETGQIEDSFDSDNKALEVYKLWKAGKDKREIKVGGKSYRLDDKLKKLLSEELRQDSVGDDEKLAAQDLDDFSLQAAAPEAAPAAPATAAPQPATTESLTAGEKGAAKIREGLKGQVETRERRGKKFQVGGVEANKAAQADIKNNNVLLNNDDTAHIEFFDRKLGIDISYDTPRDPFRWNVLKEVIATGKVDILAVSETEEFDVREAMRGQISTKEKKSLKMIPGGGARGATAVREGLFKVINASQPSRGISFVSATDRDQVFYSTGFASAAHEFFGHLWLAMNGVPFGHGENLQGTHTITDAFGEPYTGSVDDYITLLVQQSPREQRGRAENPPSFSLDVNDRTFEEALQAFVRAASAQDAFSITSGFISTSSNFRERWQALNRFYELLLVNQTNEEKRLAHIITELKKVYDKYNDDFKEAFDIFFFSGASSPGTGRTNPKGHVVSQLKIENPSQRPRKKGKVQRAQFAPYTNEIAPPIVHTTLRSPGQPLESSTRALMESGFGHDFSRVRVHTDGHAAESARAINALAYTVGQQIVFGHGQYQPATAAGRRLLSHELTHTIQQSAVQSTPNTSRLTINPHDDAHESEAEQAANGYGLRRAQALTSRPAIQRQPSDAKVRAATCEAVKNPVATLPGECIYKEPKDCATYEEWISTFTRLKTFKARTTPEFKEEPEGPHVFDVLGEAPAARVPKTASDKGAPPFTTQAQTGEQFVDHPTDDWVKTCLPDNLRATAYQLPSDCADVAVILRHVWLAAHKRTEKFGNWIIGDKTGGAATESVKKTIKEVFTGNVAAMVNPYSDATGRPLLSFAELEPLLHPGDILVWEHYDEEFKKRTGGHTHTISNVRRAPSGKIEMISVLQGNLPIFGAEAGEGPEADDKKRIIDALKLKDTEAQRTQLGNVPGRRVEADTLNPSSDFSEHESPPKVKGGTPRKIWQWGAHTLLIAAGPPKAAARPKMQKGSKVRQLSDWVIPIQTSATASDLTAVFEAMLAEARAVIEGGGAIPDTETRKVGESAGMQLWKLAKKAKDTGNESHFERIKLMRAMIQGMIESRDPATSRKLDSPYDVITGKLYHVMYAIDEAFQIAARGGSDIEFGKAASAKTVLIKTLLTGFDPFNMRDARNSPPRPGEWNPSGAAVMALDNQRVTADKGVEASVQGIVLPVDFSEFKEGMVEKIVKPHAQDVDNIITVSVDPSEAMSETQTVRLERYAVGVHLLRDTDKEPEKIPAAEGGGVGPAIIETTAPLEDIAKATELKPEGKKSQGINRPTFGEDITIEFATPDEAKAAAKVLKPASIVGPQLTIKEHAILKEIAESAVRDQKNAASPWLEFKAGGGNFRARLLSGPGGDYLSNEVSFRVLRLLRETKSEKEPFSFHVHTEKGGIIPEDTGTREKRTERKTALAEAMKVRERLITTLRRMIAGAAKIIAARRKPAATTK